MKTGPSLTIGLVILSTMVLGLDAWCSLLLLLRTKYLARYQPPGVKQKLEKRAQCQEMLQVNTLSSLIMYTAHLCIVS